MNRFKVNIKNLDRLRTLEYDITKTLQTLINEIREELQFPQFSAVKIQCEGIDCEKTAKLYDFIGKHLTIYYEHFVPMTFSHTFLNDSTIDANVLASQNELENIIKSQLLFEYRVRIISIPLNWQERMKDRILYEVVATFYIFYQNTCKFFSIDVFETFEIIKKKIQEAFTISQPFQLEYQNIILHDDTQFYQHQIPDNQQINLVVKDKVTIIIEFKGLRNQYKVTQSVEKLKHFLRKQYSIKKGIDFNLESQGKPVTILEDNQLICFKLLDFQIDLLLQFKMSNICFSVNVLSNQKISDLDGLPALRNKNFRYTKDQEELNKSKMFRDYFQEESSVQTLFIIFPEAYEFELTFKNKHSNLAKKLKIQTNQTIEQAMTSIIQQPYTVCYKNNKIDPKMKFQDVSIKDQDVITYYSNVVTITVIYNQAQQNFDLNLTWKGHQLHEFFANKLDQQNFILLYGDLPFPLDSVLESLYKPDLQFKLQMIKIQVNINFPKFELLIQEEFDQKAKISDVKEYLRNLEGLPAVPLFITYQDLPQTDEIQLAKLDLETYPLVADFAEEINVSFVNEKDELLQQRNVNLGDKLSQILSEFSDPESVQCFHNQSEINLEKSFVDLNINQNDKIQVVSNQITLRFKNKVNSGLIHSQKGNPLESVNCFFNKIFPRQAIFYVNNVQINHDVPAREIPQDSIIFYELLVKVTFQRIKGQLVCTRMLSVYTPLIDSLQGVCNKKVYFFFNNQLTDDKTIFSQITNQDQVTIAFEEQQQQVTVIDEKQQQNLSLDITATVQDVAKKLQIQILFKQFYLGDKIQHTSTKLYTLFNESNQIVLFFRGPIKLNLPPLVKPQLHQITIIDNKTETYYYEYIAKSLLVKDFIQQFQMKTGLQGVQLQYEGKAMEMEKSFDELPNEAKITMNKL